MWRRGRGEEIIEKCRKAVLTLPHPPVIGSPGKTTLGDRMAYAGVIKEFSAKRCVARLRGSLPIDPLRHPPLQV